MVCPKCGKLYCNHSPFERKQTIEEMMADCTSTEFESQCIANTILKNKCLIRRPEVDDARGISKLANSLHINQLQTHDRGFLVYPLNEEGYKRRIERARDYFYVAEKDGQLAGFIMCYDNNKLGELLKAGELNHEDSIVQFLFQQKFPFLYGDQIGIKPSFMKRKIGERLMESVLKTMREQRILPFYACVLHKPIENLASKSFCSHYNFKLIKEIKDKKGYTWGVYRGSSVGWG